MTSNELEVLAYKEGYTHLKWVKGELCGVCRFIFTIGVVYGIHEYTYNGRFCFDNLLDAVSFLIEWDGDALPEIGVDGCTAIK